MTIWTVTRISFALTATGVSVPRFHFAGVVTERFFRGEMREALTRASVRVELLPRLWVARGGEGIALTPTGPPVVL